MTLATFFSSATKTQLVVFYAGLGVLSALLLALVVYGLVCLIRFRRRAYRRGKWPGWRGYVCQEAHSCQSLACGDLQRTASTPADPPAWAMAYKRHFEVRESACIEPGISPYGMPMLRKPRSPVIVGVIVKNTPPPSPVPLEPDEHDVLTALGSPALSEPDEPDVLNTPRQYDLSPDSLHIVVDCDDESRRSSVQDTIFPVFPVQTAERAVIDYLSIPPSHWPSPDLIDDNNSEPSEENARLHADHCSHPSSESLSFQSGAATEIYAQVKRQGFYGAPADWEHVRPVLSSTSIMKVRVVACTALLTAVLLSTWLFFFVGIHISQLALGLLGDALDVVHPVPYNLSDTEATNNDLPPSSYDDISIPEDHGELLSWSSYDENSLDIFANTYVISLPHRTDRRISMERLRQAISVNWTYVDAVSAENPEIHWLMECIRSMRGDATVSSNLTYAEEFAWPPELDADPSAADASFEPTSMTSWCPQSDIPKPQSIPADPRNNDTKPEDFAPELRPLTCATRNLTHGPPLVPSLPPYMILTASKVACWNSHLQVLEKFAYGPKDDKDGNGHDVALILEDDVDIERDIRGRLRYLRDYLPENQWDILFLGHCWSNEAYHPAIATLTISDARHRGTTLHPSFAPKCTHAYAVSRSGAVKLVQHLQHPPFAYSRALDQAFAWLVLSGRVKSYSLVPSLVVQRKVTASDVDAGDSGVGSDWKDSLDDGILASQVGRLQLCPTSNYTMSAPAIGNASSVEASFSQFQELISRWSLEEPDDTAEASVRLEQCDSALRTLHHISSDFFRLTHQARRNLQRRRNGAVAINRLPTEILCSIFVAVGDNARDKLSIAQTCGFWRKIALGFPFMWTSVDLDTITTSYMASKIFRRGGDHPLRVTCREWNDLRVTCVTFELPRLQDLDLTWTSIIHNALNGKIAPSLVRLRLSSPRGIAHIQAPMLLVREHPLLEDLTLVRCRMAFTPANFHGLKKLNIDCSSFGSPVMDGDQDFLHVLESCPELETLVLRGLSLYSEEFGYEPASPVVLPRLRHMELSVRPEGIRHITSKVSAPALHRLLMRCGSLHSGDVAAISGRCLAFTILASTEFLVIDNGASTICAFDKDTRLSFLFVEDLVQSPPVFRGIVTSLAADYSMSSLRTLRIRKPRTAEVIMLLRNLPTVQTLVLIYPLSSSSKLRNAEIVPELLFEARKTSEPPFLPNLRTLAFERVYLSIQNSCELLEFMELRPGLQRLHLFWCKGDLPMDELVELLQGQSVTAQSSHRSLSLYDGVDVESQVPPPVW
ncbi:hypothetical protein NM688_g6816 [Phlebia brevispora]|uniref:Uncharacterized protein n=1 Tax=Phlebia brevispora TaxID=194682 RepID=A0ACC1SC33_9APHY|nr:hypothetical protein NM688_g6816 [Phlebia brevispora]